MMWPFGRTPELRTAEPLAPEVAERKIERRTGYSAAILTAFETAAGTQSQIGATAALEAASNAYARGLAAADASGAPDGVLRAITASMLGDAGRDLVRRGESVFLIEVGQEGLELVRCGTWDLRGGGRRADWTARVTLYGPSESWTRIVSYDQLLHFRYATDPARPWRGVSPVEWASLSSQLHARSVDALGKDMRAASATVIPMPPDEEPDDEDDDPLQTTKMNVMGAGGRSLLVETTRATSDVREAPARDWKQERLGPTPDETLASVHGDSAAQVLAACGIDPLLVGMAKGDGTALREAYRRFERLSLGPLARTMQDEIADKLDAPDIKLDFASLRASDFAGIARSLKGLVEAGFSLEQSAALLDLDTGG